MKRVGGIQTGHMHWMKGTSQEIKKGRTKTQNNHGVWLHRANSEAVTILAVSTDGKWYSRRARHISNSQSIWRQTHKIIIAAVKDREATDKKNYWENK